MIFDSQDDVEVLSELLDDDNRKIRELLNRAYDVILNSDHRKLESGLLSEIREVLG